MVAVASTDRETKTVARLSAPDRTISSTASVATIACFVGLIGADIVAFIGSALIMHAVPHLLRRIGMTPPVQVLPWSAIGPAQPELVLVGIIALLYFWAAGHYWRRCPFWAETRDMAIVSLLALLTTCLADALLRGSLPRQVLFGVWLVLTPSAMCARWLARRALDRLGLWRHRVILLGDAATLPDIGAALAGDAALGYHIVATMDDSAFPAADVPGEFRRLLAQHQAVRYVLSIDPGSPQGRRVAQGVLRDRVSFSLVPRTAGLPVADFGRASFFDNDVVLLNYRNNLADPAARALKIALDLTLASLLLLLTALPMLLIAALIRCDGGPALFGHERVGAKGRRFRCLKFRTMVVEADAALQRILVSDPARAEEWREHQKLRRDPRITWIGDLLRKTSLDELPQLINVLRLEMSLVGPRPIVQAEIARYGDGIEYYYETRPGITGLWQVSGRSDIGYARRVELDGWYVRNWTAWHDIAIIVRTVPAVLARRGAHGYGTYGRI